MYVASIRAAKPFSCTARNEVNSFHQLVNREKVRQEGGVLKVVQDICGKKRKLNQILVPDPLQKAVPCLLI